MNSKQCKMCISGGAVININRTIKCLECGREGKKILYLNTAKQVEDVKEFINDNLRLFEVSAFETIKLSSKDVYLIGNTLVFRLWIFKKRGKRLLETIKNAIINKS